MKKIFLVVLVLLAAISAQAQRNVVLIIADDLGTDYFGFNEDHADTVDVPNIRRLLSKGVRFKNFMTNPVCSATRTSILTGRYSFRTGVGGIVGGTGGSNEIDTAEMTIPRQLNYYNPTIAKADIGKWHLNTGAPAAHFFYPNLMGYNRFEGPFIGQLPSYTNWTKITNGVAAPCTNYATSENVNNAVSWLKTINSTQSFFLWLAFNAPHEPLHLPPAGLHHYTTLSGTPGNINTQPKEYFKAMIQAMDHEMGRLFDTLQRLNRLDSTDIIFIGDNGNTARTAQIADLTKAKGTVYQYGVHTPLLIAGPSVVNPNRSSDALVNSVDLFATINELMGNFNWPAHTPIAKPVDSKSILPIIKNQSNVIRPWSFCEIFKLTTDSSDGKGIRNAAYKLIRFDYLKEEFYNLSIDPFESVNLLDTSMSAVDITNYNYLCNELSTLTGSTIACKIFISGTSAPTLDKVELIPNPFTSMVKLPVSLQHEKAELRNTLGQLLYKGINISEQNFSNLPTGVYLLKLENKLKVYRLVKE